jgi:hypothetical protein
LGRVFLIEFLLHGKELTSLELGNLSRLPSFSGADERAEHQLQDSPLAECIGNDFETTALFSRSSNIAVRIARRGVMGNVSDETGPKNLAVSICK